MSEESATSEAKEGATVGDVSTDHPTEEKTKEGYILDLAYWDSSLERTHVRTESRGRKTRPIADVISTGLVAS
jgi:hypothetical protein